MASPKLPEATPSERARRVEGLERRFSPAGIAREQRLARRRLRQWRWMAASAGTAKRLLDMAVSAGLLMLLFPLFAYAGALAARHGHRLFGSRPMVGRWGIVFSMLAFTVPEGNRLLRTCRHLPRLVNVLRGQMSLVGPLPRMWGEESAEWDGRRASRLLVRPGLLSLWWVKKRVNIDYDDELSLDMHYVESQGLRADLSLVLRAAPTLLYGGHARPCADEITLLGTRIDNLTLEEALDRIEALAERGRTAQVSFVNAACANIAHEDEAYREVLAASELVLADGIGMKMAGKLLGREIRQNVNGTDLFPRLCQRLGASGRGLYLLGGRPGVPEGVAGWIARNAPDCQVVGMSHGYLAGDELPALMADIRKTRPAVILVAMGVPQQEKFIARWKAEMGSGVAIGVGGLFDFYSGRIPRAPEWMRDMGLEWLYRFYQEPGRMWRRYLVGNGVFLARVLAERSAGDAQ